MYDFSATSGNPSRGTVQIIKEPTCDDIQAEVEAIPYYGFHFVRWSDGSMDAYRYLVVVQDTAIQAEFAEGNGTEGINDIVSSELRMYVEDAHIYVTCDDLPTDEFRVYDVMGREVFHAIHTHMTPVLPGGVYMVKVDDLPARRVVVVR